MLEEAVHLDHNNLKFVENLGKLNNLFSQLESLEKAYTNRPDPSRLSIQGRLSEWADAEKRAEVAYNQSLLHSFRTELADIQAFIEMLKYRTEMNASCQKAIKQAKKWKSGELVPKNDKEKKEREIDLKKEELLITELECMNKIIFAQELVHFWMDKAASYKHSLGNFAKQQSQVNKLLYKTWKALYEEANHEQA